MQSAAASMNRSENWRVPGASTKQITATATAAAPTRMPVSRRMSTRPPETSATETG